MKRLKFKQKIKQLEKRKGGYYFLTVDAKTVDKLEKKRATRLICNIDKKVNFSCGLNHLGDGNYFIILATRHLKSLDKKLGDFVTFDITEDSNPLGVEIPEVLAAVITQDKGLKQIFDKLTDGKKRSLIFTITKIKDVDKQISKINSFLNEQKIRIKLKSEQKVE